MSAPVLAIAPGEIIYLLDFTYPAPVLESWADAGADVRVIDHHKSAMNDLAGLSSRIFKEFDMDRSGAMMAWQYFHPKLPVPELIRYVQDRDVWTKQLPFCDRVSLGLSEIMHGRDVEGALEECDRLMNIVDPLGEIMVAGEVAEAEIAEAIAQAVAGQTTRIITGIVVPFFRCDTARQRQAYSDIGHALLESNPAAPFACVEIGAGWALRSRDDRMDASLRAKMVGGGGHRNASGCEGDNMLVRWR
jgi:oligoribonuclease NrnB/cAMP/cGMP phosphodiesterase (DHH superfamily)